MHAALVVLPFALCFFMVSIWSGRLALRFGFRRIPIADGLVHALLLTLTAAAVLIQGADLQSWTLAALIIGVGVGQAFMFGPSLAP